MDEENQLSASSVRLFAATVAPDFDTQRPMAPTTASHFPYGSLAHQLTPLATRTGSTRPCPSTDQPAPKRRITAWPSYAQKPTGGRANQGAPVRTPNAPSSLLSARRQGFPPTPYSATNGHMGSFVNLMDLAAWNVTALANAQAPGRPFQPPLHSGTPGLFSPSPNRNDSLLNAPSPPHFTALLGDEAASTSVDNHDMPVYTTDQVSPLLLADEMFLSNEQLKLELGVLRSGVQWKNWEYQILLFNLLGPHAPPNIILTLLVPPRKLSPKTLENLDPVWEKVSKSNFNGSRTAAAVHSRWWHLVDQCKAIMHFAHESGLDLDSPEFSEAKVFVNRIVMVWRRRIPEGGIWGTETKLKRADVAAWTYDPITGWLSMMYQRLREANIPLLSIETPEPSDLGAPPCSPPLRYRFSGDRQTQSEGGAPRRPFSEMCSPAPQYRVSNTAPGSDVAPRASPYLASPRAPCPSQVSTTSHHQLDDPGHRMHPGRASQVSATPKDLFTESDEPYPEPVPREYSRAVEMLREQHAVSGASISVANAKANWIQSQALKTRAEVLGNLLEMERDERRRLLQSAMEIIRNPQATAETRRSIESWVTQTFFTSNPSANFAWLITRWCAESSFNAATACAQTSHVQDVPTPPLPPLTMPDSFPELDFTPPILPG